MTCHTGYLTGLVVMPNGDLVSASVNKKIRVWNLYTGKETRFLKAILRVWALSVMPNGELAIASSDNEILIMNLTTGIISGTLIGHFNTVIRVKSSSFQNKT